MNARLYAGLVFVIFLFAAQPAHAQTLIASSPASTTPRVARVPILIYHSVRPYYPGITNMVKEFTVPPEIFDEQLKYLQDNGFTPISFDEITDYFTKGTPLPQRPVIITLDDGWENQYVYAFPILQKYKFKAVFYVYPGSIGRKHFLTYTEIQKMLQGGMIIADHSQTHPELPKITDAAILKQEIAGSRGILERKLGISIKDFAYPFGKYNDMTVEVVKQSGYRTARTVHSGLNADASTPYTIDGIIITSDFNRFVTWVNK